VIINCVYVCLEKEKANISKEGGYHIFAIDNDESDRTSPKLLVEPKGYEGVMFKSAEEFLQSSNPEDAD
jgi:FixJ family two-component response regulator